MLPPVIPMHMLTSSHSEVHFGGSEELPSKEIPRDFSQTSWFYCSFLFPRGPPLQGPWGPPLTGPPDRAPPYRAPLTGPYRAPPWSVAEPAAGERKQRVASLGGLGLGLAWLSAVGLDLAWDLAWISA